MRVELEDGTILESTCECMGQIRRIKTMSQYIMNQMPAGTPIETAPREYECAECGKVLAEIKEE